MKIILTYISLYLFSCASFAQNQKTADTVNSKKIENIFCQEIDAKKVNLNSLYAQLDSFNERKKLFATDEVKNELKAILNSLIVIDCLDQSQISTDILNESYSLNKNLYLDVLKQMEKEKQPLLEDILRSSEYKFND